MPKDYRHSDNVWPKFKAPMYVLDLKDPLYSSNMIWRSNGIDQFGPYREYNCLSNMSGTYFVVRVFSLNGLWVATIIGIESFSSQSEWEYIPFPKRLNVEIDSYTPALETSHLGIPWETLPDPSNVVLDLREDLHLRRMSLRRPEDEDHIGYYREFNSPTNQYETVFVARIYNTKPHIAHLIGEATLIGEQWIQTAFPVRLEVNVI